LVDPLALANITPAAFEKPSAERLRLPQLCRRPRVLLLYGSLRARSYSRFLTLEAARLLEAFGAKSNRAVSLLCRSSRRAAPASTRPAPDGGIDEVYLFDARSVRLPMSRYSERKEKGDAEKLSAQAGLQAV
jgi:hypothetical protein